MNVGDGGQAVVAGRIGRGSRRRGPAIGLPGAAIVTAPPTIDYKTPTALSLERKNGYVLTFSMPGYTSQKMELQRKIRVGIVVLDVLAGLLGVIIDAVTGAWYELTPDVVSVSLTKVSAAVPGPDTFTVTVSTKPTKEGADLRIESTVPGVRPG